MTLHVTLKSGQAARLAQLDDDKVTLSSPVAAPPGATVDCILHDAEGTVGDFQIKVNRCRRQGDGFSIDGRLRNAKREVRARLVELGEDRAE